MNPIATIADAIVAALNAHAFSRPFTAERAYRPVFELVELKSLRVTVVPKSVEITTANRSTSQLDMQIDVGIQQKLVAADNNEIDALMDLVHEIIEHIRTVGLFGSASLIKAENDPIYSVDHLGELRTFTSVVTLTLRVMTP